MSPTRDEASPVEDEASPIGNAASRDGDEASPVQAALLALAIRRKFMR